jgi:hypothetical protein
MPFDKTAAAYGIFQVVFADIADRLDPRIVPRICQANVLLEGNFHLNAAFHSGGDPFKMQPDKPPR